MPSRNHSNNARQAHRRELTWGIVWFVTLVILVAVLLQFRGDIETGTIALIMLIAPLTATIGSLRLALFASIVSAFTFNYFFTTPYDSFQIESSTSVAAFLVYLIISTIVSVMAARLHQHSIVSEQRASHAMLLRDLTIDLVRQRVWLQPPVSSALADLVRSLHLRGAAMRVNISGGEQFSIDAGHSAKAKEAVDSLVEGASQLDPDDEVGLMSLRKGTELVAFPVATAATVYGMLAVEPSSGSDLDATDEQIVGHFANVVALACERASFVQQSVEAKTIEETDRLRVQMMGAVTHDLRTPLTSMRALASTIGDLGPLTDEQRQTVAEIEEQASRLTRLIDRVLDMSRIESGSLKLHTQIVTVDELVRSAADDVRPRAEFTVSIEDELPPIPVDEALMHQALINLLENAIRHGEPPFEMRVRKYDSRLEIRVIDHGHGIPESERRRVFDANYAMRRDAPDDRSRGLGLAVSSGFVEAHHGHIRVEPTPGGGATFVISLPIAAAKAAR